MTLELMPLAERAHTIGVKAERAKKVVNIEERRHLHIFPQPLTERRWSGWGIFF